jgi:hypothetical protein
MHARFQSSSILQVLSYFEFSSGINFKPLLFVFDLSKAVSNTIFIEYTPKIQKYHYLGGRIVEGQNIIMISQLYPGFTFSEPILKKFYTPTHTVGVISSSFEVSSCYPISRLTT